MPPAHAVKWPSLNLFWFLEWVDSQITLSQLNSAEFNLPSFTVTMYKLITQAYVYTHTYTLSLTTQNTKLDS